MCRFYWAARLVGRPVDPAKAIIYHTRNWHFVVENDDYVFRSRRYNKYRLHLHMDPNTNRISSVSIG